MIALPAAAIAPCRAVQLPKNKETNNRKKNIQSQWQLLLLRHHLLLHRRAPTKTKTSSVSRQPNHGKNYHSFQIFHRIQMNKKSTAIQDLASRCLSYAPIRFATLLRLIKKEIILCLCVARSCMCYSLEICSTQSKCQCFGLDWI